MIVNIIPDLISESIRLDSNPTSAQQARYNVVLRMWKPQEERSRKGSESKVSDRTRSVTSSSRRTYSATSLMLLPSVPFGAIANTYYGQPYYSGGMAPLFYYPQQPYAYAAHPPPRYVGPPRQTAVAPPTYYSASRYASPAASTSGGTSYTVTAQPARAPAASRRKVTFGRVDVREFRGGGRGGT